jgi:hypothetical protein
VSAFVPGEKPLGPSAGVSRVWPEAAPLVDGQPVSIPIRNGVAVPPSLPPAGAGGMLVTPELEALCHEYGVPIEYLLRELHVGGDRPGKKRSEADGGACLHLDYVPIFTPICGDRGIECCGQKERLIVAFILGVIGTVVAQVVGF